MTARVLVADFFLRLRMPDPAGGGPPELVTGSGVLSIR